NGVGSQQAPPTMSIAVLLYLLRPARQVDRQQAAAILGVQAHYIPTLIKPRIPKPLGNPKPNAPKYFAAVEVAEFARDRDFLDKAQRAIQRHWQAKNRRCNLHVEIMPDADNGRGARKGPHSAG